MAYRRAKYTAEDVTTYIIYLASREMAVGDEREREGITNLKLQKVLYFAQAYYLAKLNRALFSDKIEAWGLGPVVPNVYHEYKAKGNKPIFLKEDKSTLSGDDKKIIKRAVWETFGAYSARRLVDITHAHTPWIEAFNTPSQVISRKALKEYYGPLLNK